MFGAVRDLDIEVMRFFAGRQHPLLNDIMASIGAMASPTNTVFYLGFVYFSFPGFFREFLAGVLATWSVVYIIKHLVSRERPEGNIEAGLTSSFPSAHSATAFLIAGMLSQVFTASVFLYPVAGLIAFSRVYLQTHYLSDVVCGSILGISIFLIVI